MRVTGVKWTFDANGARKGNIHVDFTLTHPEEGLPWHKLHMTRYVTLPIQPKEPHSNTTRYFYAHVTHYPQYQLIPS